MVKDNGADFDAYMHGWMDGSMHGCRDAWMRGCMEMHAVTKEMTTTRKVQPRKRQNQHFVVVNSGGLQGQNNGFLVFVAALSMLREPFGKGQCNRF